MRKQSKLAGIATVAGILAAVAVASADVTGSSEGQITAKKIAPIGAAAVFTQTGKTVSGTIAVGTGSEQFSGEYLVQGTATAKRIKVSGFKGAVSAKWVAKITGDAMKGKIRFKQPGSKLNATLALTKNPAAPDGSTCDAVYTANQTTFTTDVLGKSLASCTTCHVADPTAQAAATRFRVTATDALATARSVAAFVDPANPTTSRVLAKPLHLVPHGGGQQILAGSTEDTALRNWVALVAASGCR